MDISESEPEDAFRKNNRTKELRFAFDFAFDDKHD